jgi:hypothetical protein
MEQLKPRHTFIYAPHNKKAINCASHNLKQPPILSGSMKTEIRTIKYGLSRSRIETVLDAAIAAAAESAGLTTRG